MPVHYGIRDFDGAINFYQGDLMRKISSYAAIFVAMMSLAVAQVHGQSAGTSTSVLDFGSVALGDQGAEIVTITNNSAFDIIVSASCDTGTGFSTDWVGSQPLSPGFSTPVNVYFDPLANGDATDVLVIDVLVNDDDPNPPSVEQETVDLIGTGGGSTDPGDLINDILAFYDQSIADGTLVSTGNHPNRRYRALRNRIRAIGWLIDQGYFCQASYITGTAILRTDGAPNPKDFVEDSAEGSALQELNDQLVLLKLLLDS